MLYQSDVDRVCEKVFAEINLSGGCRNFVDKLRAGERDSAIREMEAIIKLSVSRCIYASLNQAIR